VRPRASLSRDSRSAERRLALPLVAAKVALATLVPWRFWQRSQSLSGLRALPRVHTPMPASRCNIQRRGRVSARTGLARRARVGLRFEWFARSRFRSVTRVMPGVGAVCTGRARGARTATQISPILFQTMAESRRLWTKLADGGKGSQTLPTSNHYGVPFALCTETDGCLVRGAICKNDAIGDRRSQRPHGNYSEERQDEYGT
jgi:hypothetical protein